MPAWALALALTVAPYTCPISPLPATRIVTEAGMPDVVAVFAAGIPAGSQLKLRLMDNQLLRAEFRGVAGDRLLVRLHQTGESLAVPSRAIYSIHTRRGGTVVRP